LNTGNADELTQDELTSLYKYKYQRIIGGVTWYDIENKVTPQELTFVVSVNKLENEIEHGKSELRD